jgi:hypothetical protein
MGLIRSFLVLFQIIDSAQQDVPEMPVFLTCLLREFEAGAPPVSLGSGGA